MLYNSFPFILLFLPITLAAYYALSAARQSRLALLSLVAASLFFYGYWDWYGDKDPSISNASQHWNYLWLLIASILFNYCVGSTLRSRKSKPILTLGVAANLAALAYFKYANFFLSTANSLAGTHWPALHVVLPLGISFFTFTQIAFLVDSYKGLTEELNFNRYTLFVTFFPHLIAGPIVHHRDIMSQFADESSRRWIPANIHAGIVLFTIGLFKKVAIADTVGPWATAVFDSAAIPNFAEAWSGALSYTFQLYFDFSGYSDMAIGLALLFNIRMPDNFDAPYRSPSIIDFWSRWHITLSRFLRDYLYIPLGGNRKGEPRRYANLLITMFLGGLWHGAGWTFILWGLYHGLLLCLNHLYRSLSTPRLSSDSDDRAAQDPSPNPQSPPLSPQSSVLSPPLNPHSAFRIPQFTPLLSRPLTFLAVLVGWVLFRSTSLPRAKEILLAMVNPTHLNRPSKSMMPAGGNQWLVLAFLLLFVNLLPTTRQWMESRPLSNRHAIGLACLFFISMLIIRDAWITHAPNLFIYFQF